MSFAVAAEDKDMDEMDNVEEVGSSTRKIDVIDILDETDDSASEDDVVFVVEEKLDDSAAQMDISEVRDSRSIEQDVTIAVAMDGRRSNLNVANVANKTNEPASTMNMDIADEMQGLESSMNVVTIEEEIEGCTWEDDEYDIQNEPSEQELNTFCIDASKAFFNEWGLISHQLNSFNDFISNGLQRMFDDLGEFEIEPDYNPQKKNTRWVMVSCTHFFWQGHSGATFLLHQGRKETETETCRGSVAEHDIFIPCPCRDENKGLYPRPCQS